MRTFDRIKDTSYLIMVPLIILYAVAESSVPSTFRVVEDDVCTNIIESSAKPSSPQNLSWIVPTMREGDVAGITKGLIKHNLLVLCVQQRRTEPTTKTHSFHQTTDCE